MTWRSAIEDMPGLPFTIYCESALAEYDAWVQRVMAEPWVRGLEDLVKWTGVWVGTEEELIGELKMRAGKEVGASPDFPQSLEQLERYQSIAIDGFCQRVLGLLDYREMTEEDLEDFDVPGWSPDAPLLVYRGRAAGRPDYWGAMIRLLSYNDALPLAVLIFTGEDRAFKKNRRWTGTTTQLLKKLSKHTPRLGRVPFYIANEFRPPEQHRLYHIVDYHPDDLTDPVTREDYVLFHKMMMKWARVLKEERIGVSWEKRDSLPGTSTKIHDSPRTYWTIEAPNWEKPDLLGID